MRAARELAHRLQRTGPQPGSVFLAPLAGVLVREVGRSIARGEWDTAAPALRVRLTWRLPHAVSHKELAAAFNALWNIVRTHLSALPGTTRSLRRYAFLALRHAAHTLLHLRHALVEHLPSNPHRGAFGGSIRLSDDGPLPLRLTSLSSE